MVQYRQTKGARTFKSKFNKVLLVVKKMRDAYIIQKLKQTRKSYYTGATNFQIATPNSVQKMKKKTEKTTKTDGAHVLFFNSLQLNDSNLNKR